MAGEVKRNEVGVCGERWLRLLRIFTPYAFCQ